MRIDDIFEAMTDIDDKFIEAARPIEPLNDGQPVIAVPAPRRAMWKTLVPAAAFVAVVAAAGVVGVNYLRGSEPRTSVSSSISLSLKEYWYPEEARFVVDESISRFNCAYQLIGGRPLFDTIADYAESYEELAEESDLIVSGTFIDVIHQTSDSKEYWCDADKLQMSYNWFEVESVIKGGINSGSVLTIGQNSTLNLSNDEDAYTFMAVDQLSPMLKGDKWIYFLKQEENGTFSPVNGPQGRYPMPDYTNRFVSWDGETPCADEFGAYENAAPARDEIYAELLKQLAEIEAPELEYVKIPDASFDTFSMEEFEGVEFKVSRLGVTADDVDVFDMKDGETLETLILTDLNNDGKRELCATISGERKSVAVSNYESGAYYTLSGKRDYFVGTQNGVLMLYDRAWFSPDYVGMGVSELSLEMLTLTAPNNGSWFVKLGNGQRVSPEEFPELVFTANSDGILVDETDFGYVQHVIFGGFELRDLTLADINGDGKRELVALGDCNGEPKILAYNIETDETRIISKTASHMTYANDGMEITVNGEALNFDMMPKADVMDYSRASLEHLGMFTLPDMDGFGFTLLRNEYGADLVINYDKYGGNCLKTRFEAAYFCDLDGDGQREIILSKDDYEYEAEGGVWVYDVMDDGELGRTHYHAEDGGRVIEQNGRLLIQYDNGVSEIGYKNSDLKVLRTDPLSAFEEGFMLGDSSDYGYYDIEPDIEHKATSFNGFFPNDDKYSISIKNGTLSVSRENETLLKTGKLAELYGVTDAENDCLLFVYRSESGGFSAFLLTENDTKLVNIDDLVDNNVVLTDHRDMSINFKDGRGASLISILSLIYK